MHRQSLRDDERQAAIGFERTKGNDKRIDTKLSDHQTIQQAAS